MTEPTFEVLTGADPVTGALPDPTAAWVQAQAQELGDGRYLQIGDAVDISDDVIAAAIANPSSDTRAELDAVYAPIADPVFTGTAGFGTADGGNPRIPFNSTQEVDAAASGATDKVAHALSSVITGDLSASTGSNPTFAWGLNAFLRTGTAANDGHGGNLHNLIESNVAAPSGTITSVFGLSAQAAFFGATAGATVSNMTSMRVEAPIRKDGATGGTATFACGLFVGTVTAADVGASSAFSMLVEGGTTRLQGQVHAIANSAGERPMKLVTAASPTADFLLCADSSEVSKARILNTGVISAVEATSGMVRIGNIGPSSEAAIGFGSALDAKIYRTSAGNLATDSNITATGKTIDVGTSGTFKGQSAAFGPTGMATGGRLTVLSNASGNDVVTIRGAIGQTADVFRTQTTTDGTTFTPVFAITAAGLPRWWTSANAQTTVGAAGAASALPATPTKYLKVVDSAGTTLVIPAYAAS